MVEKPDVATLEHAPTREAATVILEMLRDEGIPAFARVTFPQDDYLLDQWWQVLHSVEIQVPRDRLDEARTVLAAAREAGRELPE